ncbi:MAG: hypothetical protein ACLQU1_16295 [Bryobacteraceae bacterium]
MARVPAAASGTPIARPSAVIASRDPTTIPTTVRALAPNAIRGSIARVTSGESPDGPARQPRQVSA